MYEALDDFLKVDTWTSLQPEDSARFYRALDAMVRNPGFTAAKVGEYIEGRYLEQYGDGDPELREYIRRRYQSDAVTVCSYLRATGH